MSKNGATFGTKKWQPWICVLKIVKISTLRASVLGVGVGQRFGCVGQRRCGRWGVWKRMEEPLLLLLQAAAEALPSFGKEWVKLGKAGYACCWQSWAGKERAKLDVCLLLAKLGFA